MDIQKKIGEVIKIAGRHGLKYHLPMFQWRYKNKVITDDEELLENPVVALRHLVDFIGEREKIKW